MLNHNSRHAMNVFGRAVFGGNGEGFGPAILAQSAKFLVKDISGNHGCNSNNKLVCKWEEVSHQSSQTELTVHQKLSESLEFRNIRKDGASKGLKFRFHQGVPGQINRVLFRNTVGIPSKKVAVSVMWNDAHRIWLL